MNVKISTASGDVFEYTSVGDAFDALKQHRQGHPLTTGNHDAQAIIVGYECDAPGWVPYPDARYVQGS